MVEALYSRGDAGERAAAASLHDEGELLVFIMGYIFEGRPELVPETPTELMCSQDLCIQVITQA